MKNIQRSIKKMIGITLSICLLWEVPAFAAGSTKSAEAPLEKRAELMIFIRFKGEPEFVSGTISDPVVTLGNGNKVRINEWYNSQNKNLKNSSPSVNQFVQSVTWNSKIVKTVYGSTDATKIASYECNIPGKEANFGGDYDWHERIQKEAIEAVKNNIPKGTILDYNEDGYVDNVNFIWGATDTGAFNWLTAYNEARPFQWRMHGERAYIDNKAVGCYTMNFALTRMGAMYGTEYMGKDVVTHEYMHTLGTDDFYTETGTQGTFSPYWEVGDWDIQSDSGAMGSTLLYQRIYNLTQSIGVAGEITQNGRYTLWDVNEPNPSNGVNGYILRSTKNNDEDEFFMVEYRRGQTDPAAAKYGDGIIVYRVNLNGNNLYPDEAPPEVHIFGQVAGFNSTASIQDSERGIGRSSSPGVLDLTNNPLTYSNGENSEICIRNVSKAGESIAFDVIFR